MIPKKIHYCWFSNDKKPKLIKQCIDSWQRVMPDYEIHCWDSDSFDFNSVPFVREAMLCKKYASAADYVRLYALYHEGGIYLDSDVKVLRRFDDFLHHQFFSGTEAFFSGDELNYDIEAAIMGSEAGHPFVKHCMDSYHSLPYEEAATRRYIMPKHISKIAEQYGYQYIDAVQTLSDNITIYSTDTFINCLYLNTRPLRNQYAVHCNVGSWIDYSERGLLFRLCKKWDLMEFYHWIEKMRMK